MEKSIVLQSIIDFVKLDENNKIAILNGSRANQNAPKDFMQDYDIAVYVKDLKDASRYKENQEWIHSFGKLVILQQNKFGEGGFIFLLQYEDGLRIDLSFHDLKMLEKNLEDDSLSVVLYDIENLVKVLPDANESSYFVGMPTKQKWDETINNLWWLQPYIAKELWRDELPLAKELYDVWIINGLRDLLSWYIAVNKQWKVNVGHGGKWFKQLLSREIYEKYISFYSSADVSEQWEKLFQLGEFIRFIAVPLSRKLGFEYPMEYDKNVSSYIRKIYDLSPNAKSFQ